jgi:hypothetical protein
MRLCASRTIAAHRDPSELFRSLAAHLHAVVHFVFLRVFLYDEERRLMRLHVSEAPGQPPEPLSEFPPEGTAVGWVYEKQEPLVIADVDEGTRFPRLPGRQHSSTEENNHSFRWRHQPYTQISHRMLQSRAPRAALNCFQDSFLERQFLEQ